MLMRFGFLGRLVLIVLALMSAVAGVGIALSNIARERGETGAERFPVPAQAAAIVELIDATPPEGRARVIKAVSSETFVVRLADRLPGDATRSIRMPGVEWLVAQYLETLPGRTVLALRLADDDERSGRRLIERLVETARAPVTIGVGLRAGGFAVFQLRGDGTRRVFGIPVGFWIGTLGFLFAALALWAIAREARPLRDLARSVSRFAQGGEPQTVLPRGAPEIRALITQINDMQARIAALLKGRTLLLGAISHDLKTFITRLRLRAEMIEPADQRARAVRDLDDMTALIDDALAVARGVSVPERRERLDLHALVAEEISRRQDARIVLAAPGGGPALVAGDPVSLCRVAANLIDNACRYADRCVVDIAKTPDGVELAVEDDGPGIPEAEWAAVFEPFYRLERSRNRTTGGSGLGLAIARQIAEAHGGTIEIGQSQLGGARFALRLPPG